MDGAENLRYSVCVRNDGVQLRPGRGNGGGRHQAASDHTDEPDAGVRAPQRPGEPGHFPLVGVGVHHGDIGALGMTEGHQFFRRAHDADDVDIRLARQPGGQSLAEQPKPLLHRHGRIHCPLLPQRTSRHQRQGRARNDVALTASRDIPRPLLGSDPSWTPPEPGPNRI